MIRSDPEFNAATKQFVFKGHKARANAERLKKYRDVMKDHAISINKLLNQ
jgi:hypothetical protein